MWGEGGCWCGVRVGVGVGWVLVWVRVGVGEGWCG